MGQRWVYTAGLFVPGKHKGINCWDAVDQMPDEVQYDHALRKTTEEGAAGFAPALQGIQQRFKKGFIEAATAPEGIIKFWDGGTVPKRFKAHKAFFLLGRPIHLIQDSYSPEHSKRSQQDVHKVVDINSYVCTKNSGAHTHDKPIATNIHHGDLIWAPNGPASIPAMGVGQGNHDDKLRREAAGALEATKATWAAFLEVRALQAPARAARATALADHLVAVYLSAGTPSAPVTTRDNDIAKCKTDTGIPKIGTTKTLKCLSRMKPQPNTEWDEYLLVPYDWDWTSDKTKSILAVAPDNIKAAIAHRYATEEDTEEVDQNDNEQRSEQPIADDVESGSENG
jgi:hypothetical protein